MEFALEKGRKVEACNDTKVIGTTFQSSEEVWPTACVRVDERT